MNLLKSFAGAVVLVLAGVVVTAAPAYADHQVCSVDQRTHIVICHVVHDPPSGHGGGAGGGGSGQCTTNGMVIPCYIPGDGTWDAAHSCYAHVMNPPPPLSDPTWGGHTTGVIMACTGGQGAGTFWSPNGGNAPPPALVLAQEAASKLRPPTLGAASNAGTGSAATTYVGIPTWLWLQGRWASITSSPAAVAGESVTATASPTSVSWSMGDGQTQVCSGPGAPYDYRDPSNPPCGYIYRIDSSGQPQDGPSVNDRYFTVGARVTWSVSWTCTGAACDQNGGTLPDMTMASPPVRWRVFQVETVVTGGH